MDLIYAKKCLLSSTTKLQDVMSERIPFDPKAYLNERLKVADILPNMPALSLCSQKI
jgi:hypothetical protein